VKIELPNSLAYEKAGNGDHSLYSPEHCCVCGRKLINLHINIGSSSAVAWLLLTRATDGSREYAISGPQIATHEELQSGLWIAPIGPDCLRKHPELHSALISNDAQIRQELAESRRQREEAEKERDRQIGIADYYRELCTVRTARLDAAEKQFTDFEITPVELELGRILRGHRKNDCKCRYCTQPTTALAQKPTE
jgi:hypothetical protein